MAWSGCLASGRLLVNHAAIWVGEVTASLAKMLAMCRATVAGVTDSSSAMALLLCPLATSPAI